MGLGEEGLVQELNLGTGDILMFALPVVPTHTNNSIWFIYLSKLLLSFRFGGHSEVYCVIWDFFI